VLLLYLFICLIINGLIAVYRTFSRCWLILSVYILMSFDFRFVRLFGVRQFCYYPYWAVLQLYYICWKQFYKQWVTHVHKVSIEWAFERIILITSISSNREGTINFLSEHQRTIPTEERKWIIQFMIKSES
jgi:hypothetical protein